MKKLLVVVDYQNDFVNGSLMSPLPPRSKHIAPRVLI